MSVNCMREVLSVLPEHKESNRSNNNNNTDKQSSRLQITNRQNDARYVAMGQQLVLTKSPDYDDELKAANNKKKNGHPFMYLESTFMTLAAIRSYCRLSYRVLEGIVEASLGDELAPHFTDSQEN